MTDRPLKLYVVGERSGNPGDWPIMCYRVYVLARSGDEARVLAGLPNEPVAEVVADEPTVLCVEQDDGIED